MVPTPDLGFNVALLTTGVAGVALGLGFGFARGAPSWLSGAVLALAFAAGLWASLAAMPLLALVCVAGASACVMASSLWRLKDNLHTGVAALLGAITLFLGGMALMDGAGCVVLRCGTGPCDSHPSRPQIRHGVPEWNVHLRPE